MDHNERNERAAGYRRTAEQLRTLATRIQYDPKRTAQLNALADGFEQLALRTVGTTTAADRQTG